LLDAESVHVQRDLTQME